MSDFTIRVGYPIVPDGVDIVLECEGGEALHYLFTLWRLIRTCWTESRAS